MSKNIEFIQIAGSSRGRVKRPRPRRQVKKARRLMLHKAESIFAWLSSFKAIAYDFTLRSCHPEGCLSYVENVFGRQRRNRALQSSRVEWGIGMCSIIKTNPISSKVEINTMHLFTGSYEGKSGFELFVSKPNQTQFSKAFTSLDNNLCNCYIRHSKRFYKYNDVKIGKG